MARILCTGGGTLGSVTPLLALVPALQHEGHVVSWIGTWHGPEQALIKNQRVDFYGIIAPKFRRYFSLKHLCVPFQAVIAVVSVAVLMLRLRPELILSAGSYVSVPVVWIGRLLGARVVVHQQDVEVGLANRLMFPAAHVVTTVLEKYDRPIQHAHVVWTGNPVRDLTPTTHQFSFSGPTILIFGGGTGAASLNALMTAELCQHADVIHCTGEGKAPARIDSPRYHPFPFLTDGMKEALTIADVVVCRAGLGTLSELAYLKKAAIVVPLPGTHQEYNAELLKAHDAAIVRSQADLTPEQFTAEVISLLEHPQERTRLETKIQEVFPAHANETYLEVIHSLLRREKSF